MAIRKQKAQKQRKPSHTAFCGITNIKKFPKKSALFKIKSDTQYSQRRNQMKREKNETNQHEKKEKQLHFKTAYNVNLLIYLLCNCMSS